MLMAPQFGQVYACSLGGDNGRVRNLWQLQHFTQNGLVRPLASAPVAIVSASELVGCCNCPILSAGIWRSGFFPSTYSRSVICFSQGAALSKPPSFPVFVLLKSPRPVR